jgi:tripartite-type tricarboxylate transporter receptor subunit TctC
MTEDVMSFNLRWLAIGLALMVGTYARAQDFPARPIRVIVGPGPDIVARIMGQKFTEAWGQQVVIDPRPAAGGAIAAEAVAKAAPDGYTLLLSSASYPINAALQLGTTDVIRDFSAVALAGSAPFILMVHPSLPVKSMVELIALAKKRPAQINYASSGNGTPPHLAAEMFKVAANINIVHVPYKGAGQAMIDLVGGQVQMAFAIVSAALPQVQAGKVRALGVTSPQASPLAPGLPTLSELGLPGFDVKGWNGFVAPAATPRAIVAKINAEAMRALKQPETVQRLKAAGYEAAAENSPEQFADFIKAELAKWTRVVRESGAKVD